MKDLEKHFELETGEYIKLLGITSVERTQLFCSNNRYIDLLELINNIEFIVTSLLGGKLVKIVLPYEKQEKEEKVQVHIIDNIIFLVYGVFPDHKGTWILEQMVNYFSKLVNDKDIVNLDETDKAKISTEFKKLTEFIIQQYKQLGERKTDHKISSTEDIIRIIYLGLSSMAIGVISLLLEAEHLKIGSLNGYDLENDENMFESMITSKIEAIAVNIQATTHTIPRLISVKLGPQKYRYLTFKKYKNNYLLYTISEGNINKITEVESLLDLYLIPIVNKTFTGNLKSFEKVKTTLKNDLEMINLKLKRLYK